MADYYQLLGVTPQASAGEIRQAYAKLAREKHPDRFTDPAAKQQAQRAFQDLTTAFNALANPKSRQEYDQAREKPGPKTPEGSAPDAPRRPPAEVASPRAAGGALGKAGGHDAAREAVQVLERVTQLAPNHATAFVELATVLARQGLKLRAQKAVEAALRIAPRDARANRLAAELGMGQR